MSPGNRVAHYTGVCPCVNAILEKILYLAELMGLSLISGED